ncbi:MAG: cytochrome P460 family protein [Candidatus Aminicenantaceae bacterium]
MKKVGISVLTLAAVVILFMGFGPTSEMPGPDAAALWEYITKESPYKDWGFWDDHKDIQPGNSPHGPFHRVYVNEVLLKTDGTPAPYGSIQVKESFDSNKKLTALTVMYKIEGFNPEGGDWFWARYSLDGKANPAGKVQGCIGCHAVKSGNDYIIVHDLK